MYSGFLSMLSSRLIRVLSISSKQKAICIYKVNSLYKKQAIKIISFVFFFCYSVPETSSDWNKKPPGLTLLTNFITDEEEKCFAKYMTPTSDAGKGSIVHAVLICILIIKNEQFHSFTSTKVFPNIIGMQIEVYIRKYSFHDIKQESIEQNS